MKKFLAMILSLAMVLALAACGGSGGGGGEQQEVHLVLHHLLGGGDLLGGVVVVIEGGLIVIDSGKPFNVIYAENNGMARGAVAALDANGLESTCRCRAFPILRLAA